MRLKTQYIVERYQLFFRWLDICTAVVLILLECSILCGAWTSALPVQLVTGGFLIIYIGLIVFRKMYVEKAVRRLLQEEDAFVNTVSISPSYVPSYFWSASGRAVLERYQAIIDRQASVELSIEASRYIALQHQINPHFLYNTLDSIRSDMLLAGEVKIADTVESLSKYFSYVVSNLEQLATIHEELGNVLDYFRVQEYRFEDRIHLEIINELTNEETQDWLIPRLTLQPIVENAVSHGIEHSLTKGTVTVRLTQTEKNLVIHVADNGVGMDPATLERLNRMLSQSSGASNGNADKKGKKRGGIALSNVNSRIKLLFGEDFGLRVSSIEHVGTDVCILVPKVTKEIFDETRMPADSERR